ncbi:hypothetical protein KI387_011607, partial [Taxus chinensis]
EPTLSIPLPIEEIPSPPRTPVEESLVSTDIISPSASLPSEPLPIVPPPPTEEYPSSSPPIQDPIDLSLPLGDHSPSATQDPVDLLLALLPTEAEA